MPSDDRGVRCQPADDDSVCIYVQHLLGVGHLRRAARIAAALGQAGLRVTLLSGGLPDQGIDMGETSLVQLPPLRSLDASFKTLVDGQDRPINPAWKARRRDQLLREFDYVQPKALLLETFPFGRRQMRFELIPLLQQAHTLAPRPLIVCLVRDIVQQRRKSSHIDETVELVQKYFDLVLVHGDPNFLRFSESFPLAQLFEDKLHYTGFVAAEPPPPNATDTNGDGEVLVSAGGGAVGEGFLSTALQARPLTQWHDRRWRFLMGSQTPVQGVRRLQEAAPPGVVVEHFRPDFQHLLGKCGVSVSQAGYNTVMDLMQTRARAVIVPFAAAGETEQTQRAAALMELGLAQVVSEQELTPARLAQAIDLAGSLPKPSPPRFDFGGARNSVRVITQRLAAA